MEHERAREIIKKLANGINPVTGEILPESSPYNAPDVIRALFLLLGISISDASKEERKRKKTIEEKQQENLTAGRPKNAGLPWSEELAIDLAEKYRNGMTIEDLARLFERTQGAIVAELEKQGLINPDSAALLRQQNM